MSPFSNDTKQMPLLLLVSTMHPGNHLNHVALTRHFAAWAISAYMLATKLLLPFRN